MATYVLFWSASLLSGLGIRGKISTNIFLFVVFLFVGLRLETGFDWPVYKAIYVDFEREFSLAKLALYSVLYGQEPGFLFLLGFSSQFFPNFEVFQAIVTIVLLWSTVFLTRALGVRKVAMVVAIAMTYLMWSVAFSTLRQSMAISFFNFGLVFFLQRKNILGVPFFVISTFFQLSSVIYIAAFVASRYMWRTKKPPALSTFLLVTIGAAFLAPVAIQMISLVSSFAGEKLEFYLELSGDVKFGLLDVAFLIFFGASALLVSRGMVKPDAESPYGNEIRRLIMVLSALGASSSFLTVLRDRVSYELFILISVYLMMHGLRHRWYFVGFFVSFGLLNSIISIFPYPMRLAFAPYQNIIIDYALDQTSTGASRNANFMEALVEMNKR